MWRKRCTALFFPIRETVSKNPGLTLRPVRATRQGWINSFPLIPISFIKTRDLSSTAFVSKDPKDSKEGDKSKDGKDPKDEKDGKKSGDEKSAKDGGEPKKDEAKPGEKQEGSMSNERPQKQEMTVAEAKQLLDALRQDERTVIPIPQPQRTRFKNPDNSTNGKTW